MTFLQTGGGGSKNALCLVGRQELEPPPTRLGVSGSNAEQETLCNTQGCGFFAYSWKLPAYSGAFLLTIDNFSFFAYNWSFFTYNLNFFNLQLELFSLQWEIVSNKRHKGLQAKRLNCTVEFELIT